MCGAGVDAGAAAVFACCGTGEFHALTPEEYRAAVSPPPSRRRAGRVPVRRRRRLRHRPRRAATRASREEAGADGLLAMPPYLVVADQARAAAPLHGARRRHRPRHHRLPARQRRLHPGDRGRTRRSADGIIGLKDGVGDLDLHAAHRQRRAHRRARTATSCTSTACPPPNSPASPTAASASRSTPRPSSASPRRSPSPSTGRWPPATTTP